ncbi:hypothetical protein OPV22_003755 [Ensete ventricosum]|uniref:Uncharacterized protein n=1 Tax=Ensete ventricosum TaxID=4639 RepID=A0AAV8S1U2_ENSVE|nr:hypothetical protein OPV22_003755 [Ensete ventricosum]RWW33357.1 hypothetical protein GW17_00001926 [Ensete ventricosum]RWW90172.1 hypothetical protein BHE74_00000685 [Ensete ventricosum]RZR77114.1 hypothetical protein BHM03_00002103 [Ensete ventricosum]
MSGVERRKRPSLSCLPCFLGSPVSEHSDVPKQQSLCACSEHKHAPWFSWSQPQKKRTRKKTSLAVDAPAAAAADRDGLFSKSSAKRRSRESKHPNLDAGKKPAQLRRKPPDRSMLMASKPDRAGVLGPCAGLWVMALTMAVTLLSGPVAAAVCLFSCSYLLPLPRTMTTVVDGPAIAQAEVTGDSMEHKKRVILQGLLQRTGPRTITVCY